MKILIFDFNEDFYPLYERKLRELPQISIFFAKDIANVLECIEKDNPECILMNHLFYEKFDYYNKIRENGFKGDIIITIAGNKNVIKRGYYNGISGIIDKSLNGKDFRKEFCDIMNL